MVIMMIHSHIHVDTAIVLIYPSMYIFLDIFLIYSNLLLFLLIYFIQYLYMLIFKHINYTHKFLRNLVYNIIPILFYIYIL